MTTLGPTLPDTALNQLFRDAHTVHAFKTVSITDEKLRELYDLLKWAPTAFNAQPARFVFVRSLEAKEKLKPALSSGNVSQSQSASVTVIVGYDTRFQDHLPTQFPVYDAKPLFDGNPILTQATAERNSALQGAYLILAARALGLDAGPQSGFDANVVNQAFFPDGRFKVNLLVNLGVADPAGIFPGGPRLPFDAAAQIL